MSAIVRLSATEAKELFGTLSALLPSKSEATPIGLQLEHNNLSLTLNSGYIASYSKWVDSNDVGVIVFMYQDIHPFLYYSSDVILEFDNISLAVRSEECTCTFPAAFSDISHQDFSNYNFTEMQEITESEIRKLVKLGLERLYRTTYPVYVRGGIAIIKFPSFYAQVRIMEPFDGISMSLTHWSIVEKFRPTAFSQDNPQCLLIRRNAWTLMLPCTTSQQDNNFMPLLQDMSSVLKMNLHEHTESVRVMARVKGVDYCTVTLYRGGLRTSTTSANIQTDLPFGDTSGEIVNVCTLPINVWLTMLNAVGDSTAEILLGGGKLCLRNHIIAMLLRVAG